MVSSSTEGLWTAAWMRAIWLGIVLFSQAVAANEPPNTRLLDDAITRALGWMQHHPATPVDGGLLDMIDEGVFFLMMRNLAATSDERERYAQALRARMARVEALPAFGRWVQRPGKSLIEHYHLLLTAYLMRLSGQPSLYEKQIVRGAQRALASGPRAGPTVALTVAVLLDRLDAAALLSRQALLGPSLVSRIGKGYRMPLSADLDPRSRYLLNQQLYALIHEVLSLTGFGREAPGRWLAARREAVIEVLRRGVSWARATGNVDLVAELLVSAHLLGEPLSGELEAAAMWLVDSQQADGSWGAQSTSRENKRRHATMTGAFALVIYRGDLAQRSNS
jgi:hypothetical protein